MRISFSRTARTRCDNDYHMDFEPWPLVGSQASFERYLQHFIEWHAFSKGKEVKGDVIDEMWSASGFKRPQNERIRQTSGFCV